MKSCAGQRVCAAHVCFALVLASDAAAAAGGPIDPAGTEWSTVNGDVGNTRFSTLAQINVSNVKKLGGAWLREFDSPTRTAPVVIGGVMFISDGTTIYALDPLSGATIWEYKPSGAAPARGGPAVGDGKVFVGLSDARIVALEQTTGRVVWTAYIGNATPEAAKSAKTLSLSSDKLDSSVTLPPFNPQVGFISNAPTYINGVVTSGLSGGDAGSRGMVAGLDANSGKLLWRFYVIPTLGEPGSETWPSKDDSLQRGGGAVWTVGAADPVLDLVYYGTGNAVPQNGGETRPGDNLYTTSVIALDAKSGALKWHFQLVHHDIFEMDVGTPIVLYDARQRGRTRKALAALRDDGYLFMLDRETGEPLFPIEERPVKQDVRQKTAATQPFPVGADEFGPACTEPETLPSGFKPGCYFDPQYFDHPDVATPMTNVRQAPMSYDPQTGYFYIMGGAFSMWYPRSANPYAFTVSHPPGSKEYGIFAAIDSRTNKIVWRHRSSWALFTGSGALTTAGRLLFHVEGDGNVVGSDVSTGKELWRFQTGFLGAGVISKTSEVPVATYKVHGEQYISVPLGKALWAIKLDGKLPPRSPRPPPSSDYSFTGMVTQLAADGEIAIGTVAGNIVDSQNEHFFDEYAFSPGRARIKANQPLKWTNYGVYAHTISSADGSWTTGLIQPAQTIVITIPKPGSYVYFAKEFPFAKGQLVVQ